MNVRHYLVSGRVQGVFYRASAGVQATSLGLRGWVRNLQDGRVEVLAIGEAEALSDLENWLEIGPEYAKVTTIEGVELDLEAAATVIADAADSFEIRPTAGSTARF